VSAKDNPVAAVAHCYPVDSDSDISNLSDEKLMQFLKCGRQDALTVLFDRYHHLVFSIALRIVRDPGEPRKLSRLFFSTSFEQRRILTVGRAYLKDGCCSSRTMVPCTGSVILLPTTSTVGRNSKLC